MIQLPYLTEQAITQFIEAALREDVGSGDHSSSLASIDSVKTSAGSSFDQIFRGYCRGIELAKRIFNIVDPNLKLDIVKHDGDCCGTGRDWFVGIWKSPINTYGRTVGA